MTVKCDICGHRFASREAVDEHLRTDHAAGLSRWQDE
jgi:hypothetical protein